MNLVPQYLADVFYLPPEKRNKKTYNPRVTTVARTITDEVHEKMYREKQESKAKKEKGRQKTSSREEVGDKVNSRKQQENKETARKKERKRRIY